MCREWRERTSRDGREAIEVAKPIAPGGSEGHSSHDKPFRASNDECREAVHSDPSNADRPAELPAFFRRFVRDTGVPNKDAIPEQRPCVPAASHGARARSLPPTARHRRSGIRRRMLTESVTRASVAQRRCSTHSRKPRSSAIRHLARHTVSETNDLTSN